MNINNYTNCQFVEWNDGTISRCNSYGKILGNLTGSMCKDNRNTVEYCNNYGEINGQSCVGGIAYYNSGKISKCNNYGDIYGGTQSTGGIASSSSATLPTYTISNCSNYGNISSSAGTVGGIVGNGNGASIENCRNLGNINGNSDVSGIGKNINATRCYAICNLSGKNCCGIDCYNNEYMSCYYAGNTTKISPSSSANSYSFNFSGMDIDTVNSKINVLNGGFDYYKINTSLNYQNGYPVFIEDENRYDIEFEESEYGAASVDVPYSIAGEDIEINIDTISKYTSTNITIYDGELNDITTECDIRWIRDNKWLFSMPAKKVNIDVQYKPIIRATSVNIQNTLSIQPEEEYDFVSTVLPSDTTDRIIWSSSNEAVATIDTKGHLIAKSAGNTVITALCGMRSSTCSVTVEIPLEGIMIEDVMIKMNNHTTYPLDVSYIPEDTTDDKGLIWESSAPEIADVDSDGTITAYNNGTAIITATSLINDDVSFAVTVVVVSPLKSITLNKTSIKLNQGYSDTLKVNYNPIDTTDSKIIKWKSSNSSIVSVSSTGKINAISAGTATITATVGKISAKCTVTVNPKYYVSFNANGGSIGGFSDTMMVFYENKYGTLPTPTRKGYTFAGWYSASAGGYKVTASTVYHHAGDSIIYARWKKINYTISYNLNGGSNSYLNPKTYSIESSNITFKVPKRKKYVFGGWYTNASLTNKINGIRHGNIGNKRIYAKWIPVNVGKGKVQSVSAVRSKKMKIKISAVSQAKGYEISYSTTSNFTARTTKKISTTSKTITIKSLKLKTVYYVRVRAYKIDSTGAKVYGQYSSYRKIKITK